MYLTVKDASRLSFIPRIVGVEEQILVSSGLLL